MPIAGFLNKDPLDQESFQTLKTHLAWVGRSVSPINQLADFPLVEEINVDDSVVLCHLVVLLQDMLLSGSFNRRNHRSKASDFRRPYFTSVN
jgi:hypothetical protein